MHIFMSFFGQGPSSISKNKTTNHQNCNRNMQTSIFSTPAKMLGSIFLLKKSNFQRDLKGSGHILNRENTCTVKFEVCGTF